MAQTSEDRIGVSQSQHNAWRFVFEQHSKFKKDKRDRSLWVGARALEDLWSEAAKKHPNGAEPVVKLWACQARAMPLMNPDQSAESTKTVLSMWGATTLPLGGTDPFHKEMRRDVPGTDNKQVATGRVIFETRENPTARYGGYTDADGTVQASKVMPLPVL